MAALAKEPPLDLISSQKHAGCGERNLGGHSFGRFGARLADNPNLLAAFRVAAVIANVAASQMIALCVEAATKEVLVGFVAAERLIRLAV